MMKFFLIFLVTASVVLGQDYVDVDDWFDENVVTPEADYKIEGTCEGNASCVPYYKCQNSDGRGIFNIRGNFKKVVCKSLEVCCSTHEIIHKDQEMVTHEECGTANPKGLGPRTRVETNFTQFGEFPWMVALLRKEKKDEHDMKIFLCGGTLIHPRVILSSAHNVESFKNSTIIARAGEWDTQSDSEILEFQERKIKKIVSHPEFTRKNLFNDIALMFLEKPFDLKPHINVACLPDNNFVRDECIATGWGKNEFGRAGSYQVFLKKVVLPLVDSQDCQSMLRETRLGEDFLLHEGFICGGGSKDVDTCTGDGGGPLVCPIEGLPDRYALVGIVAWGIGCNKEGHPGVYMNVPLYKSWIQSELKKAGVDIIG